MSRHRAGADPGSAGTPVSASRHDAATPVHRSPSSAISASTHRNHAEYHGRRYGAATAACLSTARARRSRGRRAATDHTHRSSGMAATILTSVVTVSTAVTANGRGPSDLALGAARKAAAARPAATSASLWPPPTVWITITGFSAISRIAAGARARAPQSLAAAAPKPAAAATASAATTLNAAIVPAGEPDHSRAIPAE